MHSVVEFASTLPATTRSILVTIVALACYTTLFLQDGREYVICVYHVFYMRQWWRILTSNFAHSSVLHCAMNMMSFVPMGRHLEHTFGSLVFFGLVLYFSVAIGLLYLVVCWVLIVVMGEAWLTYCSIGFSGVLFALLVVQLEQDGTPQSLFGMITVPPRVFPFALAVLLQAAMPQVSALGHGCGIVVGFLHCFGYLDVSLPSAATVRMIESHAFLTGLRRLECFVPLPETMLLPVASTTPPLSLRRRLWQSLSAIVAQLTRQDYERLPQQALPPDGPSVAETIHAVDEQLSPATEMSETEGVMRNVSMIFLVLKSLSTMWVSRRDCIGTQAFNGKYQ